MFVKILLMTTVHQISCFCSAAVSEPHILKKEKPKSPALQAAGRKKKQEKTALPGNWWCNYRATTMDKHKHQQQCLPYTQAMCIVATQKHKSDLKGSEAVSSC